MARKGEVVTRRGDKADAMYFIVAGEVEIELPGDENVRLSDGDFFGEVAILTGEERNATVRAVDDTLMHRVPEIGRRIREVGHVRAPDRVAAVDARVSNKRSGDAPPREPNRS